MKKPDNSVAECFLCRMDANRRKTFAADRLQTPMGGSGRLALFGKDPEQHRAFANQVASEKRMRLQSDDGRTFDIWSEAPDNHFWDVVTGLCTGAAVTGLQLDDPKPRRKKKAKPKRKKKRARVLDL